MTPSSVSSGQETLFQNECSLAGEQFGVPLFQRLAVIHSQQASRIGWHSHKSFELLFLADGTTSYEFGDGRTIDLPGGHFLVIPPEVRHRGLQDVRTPVRLCGVMLNFKAKRAWQNTSFTAEELRGFRQTCVDGAITVHRMNPELRRVTRVLALLTLSGEPDELLASTVRLNLCAALLEVTRQLRSRGTMETSRTVEVVTRLMEQRLADPLQMSDLAEAAQCSRARLFQIFKDVTGMTPNDYLQRLRIRAAQTALVESDRSITVIALDHGFSSSQYFSTVFRKYTGSTPAEFRKQKE